jgi:hypothetical protein
MSNYDPEYTLLQTRQVRRAMDALLEFKEIARSGQEASLATLQGDSRVGKSFITTNIIKSFPQSVVDGKTTIPVLQVMVPSKPSIRSFFEKIAKTLGVPFGPRDSNGMIQARVLQFLEICGVELLILNEFQHLSNTLGSDREGVCDTIKSILNEGQCAVLAAGIETVEEVIDYDPQLLGRRIAKIELYPFCDRRNPDFLGVGGDENLEHEFGEYTAVLRHFSVGYDCEDVQFLTKRETVRQVLCMTQGLYGQTVKLIKWASMFAKQQSSSSIEEAMLLEAFKRIHGVAFDPQQSSKSERLPNKKPRSRKKRSPKVGRAERKIYDMIERSIPSPEYPTDEDSGV